MDEVLGNIYCWFESLFGEHLAEYLWGYNCDAQTYDRNLFNQTGLITGAVSLFCVVLYYYFINHPRFNRWWSWFIVLAVSSAAGLFIAYGRTVSDFRDGNIGDCLMYVRDEEGNITSHLIFESDCWMFGVTNAIVSAMFFVAFSFMFKWWSSNCKHSPFL
jgi:hypothetical protein